MANYEQQVILRDGALITVRAIEPEDRGALAAGFEALSAESRYRRFFAAVSDLTDRQLDYLTRVDHHDHEALVALADDGTGIGVARYVRTGPGEAEPAIAVADDWHSRGVAWSCSARWQSGALDEGITHFNASVLATNPEAIAVLRGSATRASPGTDPSSSCGSRSRPPTARRSRCASCCGRSQTARWIPR